MELGEQVFTQAFGREAKEATVIVAGMNPNTGTIEDCRVVAWQSLNASIPPTVRSCDDISGEP